MKLTRLKFKGLTVFQRDEPVSIDFEALGPGLIALVGPNGAGKSTTMEAVPAALHKQMATRPGSLYDHCSGADAFISAWFRGDDDAEIEVRVQVDAEKKKTEGYVIVNGESLTTGRSVEFDETVQKVFGSRALFLSSVFAAQNHAGSFLEMKRSDRKGLFIELLALGILETYASAAKEQRAEAEKVASDINRDVLVIEAELKQLPELKERSENAEKVSALADVGLAMVREEETRAVDEYASAKAAAQEVAALKQASDSAGRELNAKEQAIADCDRAIQGALEKAEQSRRILKPDTANSMKEAALARLEQENNRIMREAAHHNRVIDGAPTAVEFDSARIQLVDAETKAHEQLTRQFRIGELQGEVRTAQALHSSAEQRLEQALANQRQQISTEKQRAALIDSVPCGTAAQWVPVVMRSPTLPAAQGDLAGTCPLLANARAAKDHVAQLEAMGFDVERLAVSEAAEKLAGLKSTLLGLGDGAEEFDWRSEIDRLKKTLEHEPLVGASQQALERLVAAREAAEERFQAELKAADVEQARITALSKEIEERAVREVAEHRANRERAVTEHATAAALWEEACRRYESAATMVKDLTKLAAAADVAKQGREVAEQSARLCATHAATARAEHDALAKRVPELEDLRANLAKAQAEQAEWTLLESAFGQNGIQALEIDAAGPEVANLTNDLMESCYGPRFSLSFETMRQKRDGTYSEAFDVLVYDGAEQRTVEALSGGERVIVGEAISLALAIHNARKSGIRWRTLFRDETAGALDPENASKYVAMLRRALKLGGFEQCIFVAHLPQVYEAADVQLLVADGRVCIGGAT